MELRWLWFVALDNWDKCFLACEDQETVEQVVHWLNHYEQVTTYYWWSDKAILAK